MPITIQNNKLQIRNAEGNYVSIDAVSDATVAERIAEINAAGATNVASVNEAGTTNVGNVNSAGATQVNAINTKATEVTAQLASSGEMEDMVAQTFNTSTAYSAGTYVIQTVNNVNKLYRFNTDHAAGAWNVSEVTEIKLGNEVTDLKSALSDSLYRAAEKTGSALFLNIPFNTSAKDVVKSDPNASIYVGGNMFPLISEDSKTNNGVTVASDGKGKLAISGTATAYSVNLFYLPENFVFKAGMYIYFRNTAILSGAMLFYTPEGTAISGGSITFNAINRIYEIPENGVLDGKTVSRIGISVNAGNTASLTIEPMLLWIPSLTEYTKYYPEVEYSNASQFPLVSGINYVRVTNGTITLTILEQQDFATVDYVDQEIMDLFVQEYTLESGKYNESDNGNKIASLARIRNSELISLDYVKSVIFPSGYDAQIHFFDKLKGWIGYNPDWVTFFKSWQASADTQYIAFTIKKTATPNADISEDVNAVQSGIKYSAILEEHMLVSDVYEDVTENLRQAQRTRNTSKNNYLTRNKPLTLFHFSDIHQEQRNLRDILNYASENSGLIDDVICTGDIVGARFQNGMSWFDGVSGSENILLAIGNHDVMNASTGYDDSQTATLEEIYTQFIAPYYANWGLTSAPTGATYYYKDYSSSKVRLIVLDCMLDNVDASADALQYAWFVNALADAVTNGFYVVVANHCFPSGSTFVTSNWTNADYQESQTYLDARYPEAVDTFIDNGGHFVCWIEGHSHADYYMNYTGTHGTQIAISVDAASRSNAEPFTDVNRLENDRSYNSANLITIDTGAEVIKVIKFGAKCNYKLIPRNTLTLGFDGTIIAQN